MNATAHTTLCRATATDRNAHMTDNATLPRPRPIELLAPARDADTAIEAIRHGADAVYIGASSHGARQSAANGVAEIRRVCRYAHRFGAKVYVTVNTIVYDNELDQVRRLVHDLWRAGADALIVQDMALLEMDLPPIPLHASTQCDTRTPEKARFLEQCGFSQIVLARELTAAEIEEISRTVTTPLEVFVHGALCVSYSGDCQASWVMTGRSANRGECAQICRLKYNLEDAGGNILLRDKHLLSLRDMNRIAHLSTLLQAGVSSFKIEGRLKDAAYVKNVVAAYRRAIDNIIDAQPHKYRRASCGHSETTFIPDLDKSFNRGYTPYFLASTPGKGTLAQFGTPKWIGEHVGEAVRCRNREIEAKLTCRLNNGDGLSYFTRAGEFKGFRVNRAEGNRIFTATATDITPGTALYRNSDTAFTAAMQGHTARRTLALRLTLRPLPWGIALDASPEHGPAVTVTARTEMAPAKTPQEESRGRALRKTGDTCYRVTEITDLLGPVFVPASILSGLRRDAIYALEKAAEATRRPQQRETPEKLPELIRPLTRHDNIANRLSERFYRNLGATALPPSIETAKDSREAETQVMECRYCLRRELGACLKIPGGKSLPSPLYITTGSHRFRLEFDCSRCVMRLWHQNQ